MPGAVGRLCRHEKLNAAAPADIAAEPGFVQRIERLARRVRVGRVTGELRPAPACALKLLQILAGHCDVGARRVDRADVTRVRWLDLDEPIPIDVDIPDDLTRL